MRAAIIADDLTGAGDSGVQLARSGLRAAVLFRQDAEAAASQDAVVLNTDSRAVPRDEAYRLVREAAEFLAPLGFDLIYKKMDSTLRGNIGAELDAMLDVFEPDLLIAAPGYPANGRRIVGGYHYLHGRLLHETEAAADPKTPVTESYVPRLIAGQMNRRVELIASGELARGAASAAAKLELLRRAGVRCVVCDSDTSADLDVIVEAAARADCRVVWAGSAGLAEALSRKWLAPQAGLPPAPGQGAGGTPEAGAAPAGIVPAAEQPEPGTSAAAAVPGPVLAVVGSVSGRARRQLELLLAGPDTAGVELDSGRLAEGGAAAAAELDRGCAAALAALWQGRDTALYPSAGETGIAGARRRGARRGLDASGVSEAIADALGEAAARLVAACRPAGLVMTGGDTAGRICARLGALRFELAGEVESGVPVGRLAGGSGLGGGLPAVTKAGSFGSDGVLAHAVRILKGERQQ